MTDLERENEALRAGPDGSAAELPFGDTTVSVTNREVALGAVRYATPEEVLQIRVPEVAFQVSQEGYESMKLRARYLISLRPTP